jgi:DNA helicase-2/ATP-dependent DNA helicase PcrA
MKERIAHLIGGAVEGMPWLGTFHSIGVKLLRRHAELVGLRSDFTILDTDDQSACQAADPGRRPRRQALAGQAVRRDDRHWKNRASAPTDMPRATPARSSPTARAASSTPPTRSG